MHGRLQGHFFGGMASRGATIRTEQGCHCTARTILEVGVQNDTESRFASTNPSNASRGSYTLNRKMPADLVVPATQLSLPRLKVR
jgi:hypothetical protein